MYTLKPSEDYSLLDSGEGYKLEKFGAFLVSRPDPQAIWKKKLKEEWSLADFEFIQKGQNGKWRKNKEVPKDWVMSLSGILFNLTMGNFKHLGIFPEQSVHFKWLKDKIEEGIKENDTVSVLNLFGYTGGASVFSAKCGAEVCHVDASRVSVDTAFKNCDLNNLEKAPIKFIVDDVKKFIEKEIRRGKTYDIVIMDPPLYGRGTKNEVWNLNTDLPKLLSKIPKLLSKNKSAVLLNGYASNYSHITYKQVLESNMALEGKYSSDEIYIEETSGRLLPVGIFSKWEK
ncbi:MAG: class I SAM-dependent methyltransferase [Candidatus Paceibacterota bacterium]